MPQEVVFIVRDRAGNVVQSGAKLTNSRGTHEFIEGTSANYEMGDGWVRMRKPDGSEYQIRARAFGLTVTMVFVPDVDVLVALIKDVATAALDRHVRDQAWFPGPRDVARCLGWDVTRVLLATIELLTSGRGTLETNAPFFAHAGWLYVVTDSTAKSEAS